MSDVELTSKQYNKIKRAIKSLNDVRKDIQSDNPEYNIQWYIENGTNVHLLSGDLHKSVSLGDYENFTESDHEAIIETFFLSHSECGGW